MGWRGRERARVDGEGSRTKGKGPELEGVDVPLVRTTLVCERGVVGGRVDGVIETMGARMGRAVG